MHIMPETQPLPLWGPQSTGGTDSKRNTQMSHRLETCSEESKKVLQGEMNCSEGLKDGMEQE
jgi:hypothetical protein